MANVAKNIKRLRQNRKLTQDGLAEKISVTRQTISSWETDRTRPDIDMLEALSAALETDIEELIYGRKKNIGLEADKRQSRRTLSIVLAVLGSVLTAVGLILTFVFLWQQIPGVIKTFFAFLPLAAGAGGALYVLFRKEDSVLWREGGSVVWIAGLLATNALINSIYSIDFGFFNLLLADIILILPMMFLMKAASPFAVFAVLSCVHLADVDSRGSAGLHFLLHGAFLGVILLFLFKNELIAELKKFCAGITLLSVLFHYYFLFYFFCYDRWIFFLAEGPAVIMPTLFSVSLCFFFLGSGRRFGLELEKPGAVLTALCCFAYAVLVLIENRELYFSGWSPVLLLFFLPPLSGLLFGGRRFGKKPEKIVFACTAVLYMALIFVFRAGAPDTEYVLLLMSFLQIVMGAMVLIGGIRGAKLSIANFGIVWILAVSFLLLIFFAGVNILLLGLAFTATGGILLLTNKRMIKKFRKEEQGEEAETNA